MGLKFQVLSKLQRGGAQGVILSSEWDFLIYFSLIWSFRDSKFTTRDEYCKTNFWLHTTAVKLWKYLDA